MKQTDKSFPKSQPNVARTLFGIEEILAEELISLGAKNTRILNRAVSFDGDTEVLYKANLYSRFALDILFPVAQFKAQSEHELYEAIFEIPWENYMSLEQTLVVESIVHSQTFRHSHYVALKVKDAIADRFRKNTGKRPSVDAENPDLRINIHISNIDCSVSLNSSGESLHKRGYRKVQGDAPLNVLVGIARYRFSIRCAVRVH
jgi:putative N6-adenine-specific DNA methylase